MNTEQEKAKILIAGNSREFLIVNIKAELERRKYDVEVCAPTVDGVSSAGDDVKVCLLFLESAGALHDLYIYLKDTVFDKRLALILVGEKLGVKEALSEIGEDNTEAVFERPVDSRQISDRIEKAFQKYSKDSGRKSILIVDDDPGYLRRTQRLLNNRYKVYIVNSAAAMMMLLAKHRVDLILLDYLMPVVDGVKALEMLKGESETSDTPVIMLTGSDSSFMKEQAQSLGAVKVFDKGMSAAGLIESISEFFVKKDWDRIRGKELIWPDHVKAEPMLCSKCMLGKTKCALRQEGSVCGYETLGIEPPKGRTP